MSAIAKRGRPTAFQAYLAEEILDRLADGESLRSICSDPNMPSHVTVLRWVGDNAGKDENGANGFSDQYARVRSAAYDMMAEEVIEIGDNPCLFNGIPDNVLVQRARLMSDNRKWLLSKRLPKQFGDKVTQELTSDPDRPLLTRIELVAVVPQHRLPKPEDDE